MKNVIISNPQKFKIIKKQLLKGKFENLQIISDFDRTLTHAFVNKIDPVPSLISILRDEDYLIKGYSDKAKDLFKYYHAIEIDISISLDKRKKAMIQWWKKHSELLIESGLNKKDLELAAKSNRIKFRRGCFEFINLLNKENVPFVIFSASGLGEDSLNYTLKYHHLKLPNISIISNKYLWDEDGNAIDYIKPQINTFNKNINFLKNTIIFNNIKNRKNVILLGDSLGDVDMVKGFNYKNLLKIGFLNSNIDFNLEEYKKNYDVIITNDSSMEFIYSLIKEF